MADSARVLSILAGALLVASVAGSSSAQMLDINKKVKAALHYYLNVDCLVGEKRKPLAELVELQKLPGLDFKSLVEYPLAQLLVQGPEMQKTLDSLQLSLDHEWAQREAYLQMPNTRRDLKQEEFQFLQSVTKVEYMDQQRNRLNRKYRARAAIALAAIGSKNALATLNQVTPTADKDLQRTIRSAVKQFKRE